jgi:hypothetical protein
LSRDDLTRSQAGREPGFLATLKWSAVMMVVTLVVAAVSIPILRWFGVEWD